MTRPATGWSATVTGHLLGGVTEPVPERAFRYWKNVDKNLGDKIEQGSAPGNPDRLTRP